MRRQGTRICWRRSSAGWCHSLGTTGESARGVVDRAIVLVGSLDWIHVLRVGDVFGGLVVIRVSGVAHDVSFSGEAGSPPESMSLSWLGSSVAFPVGEPSGRSAVRRRSASETFVDPSGVVLFSLIAGNVRGYAIASHQAGPPSALGRWELEPGSSEPLDCVVAESEGAVSP